MYLDGNIASPRLGVGLIRLLRHRNNDATVDGACADLATDFGGVWNGSLQTPTISVVSFGVYRNQDSIIFAFLGATYLEAVARFCQGVNLRPSPNDTSNMHWGAWIGSAGFAPGYFQFYSAANFANVIFTGHSYGGGFSPHFFVIYKSSPPHHKPRVFSV